MNLKSADAKDPRRARLESIRAELEFGRLTPERRAALEREAAELERQVAS